MRFLIVATAIFACAAAAPSHLAPNGLLAYGALPVAHSIVSPINSGDLQAAAIDAHVEASDNVQAVVDQTNEFEGKAVNIAEDQAWQAVNAAQVAEAEIDGAAAAISPAAAKAAIGSSIAAPISYAAGTPFAISAYSAPVYGSLPITYSAPLITGYGGSQSVSSHSLSQTHPSPVIAYNGLLW